MVVGLAELVAELFADLAAQIGEPVADLGAQMVDLLEQGAVLARGVVALPVEAAPPPRRGGGRRVRSSAPPRRVRGRQRGRASGGATSGARPGATPAAGFAGQAQVAGLEVDHRGVAGDAEDEGVVGRQRADDVQWDDPLEAVGAGGPAAGGVLCDVDAAFPGEAGEAFEEGVRRRGPEDDFGDRLSQMTLPSSSPQTLSSWARDWMTGTVMMPQPRVSVAQVGQVDRGQVGDLVEEQRQRLGAGTRRCCFLAYSRAR